MTNAQPAADIPPQDLTAEQTVLGSMLIDNQVAREVADILQPTDFYREANANVFRAMLALLRVGEPLDFVTVKARMESDKTLDLAGGLAYLTALANAVPIAQNGPYYAGIVAEKSRARRLQAVLRSALSDLQDSGSAAEALAKVEGEILALGREETSGREPRKLIEVAADRIQVYAQPANQGVQTGFGDLDRLLGGLLGGDLVIVAARSSMGKTAIARVITRQLASRQGAALLFSMEMSETQQADMFLAAEAKVNTIVLRNHALTKYDWARVDQALQRFEQLPIFIDDQPRLKASEIRARTRRFKARVPDLALVAVDYLQIMAPERARENRNVELSETTAILKTAARELDVPFLVLSQLNRDVDKRPDHRPVLSDLRDSGAIEQDADIVMFIYREDYYKPDTDKKGIAEVIVAKHRGGPPGTVELAWVKDYAMFKGLDKRHSDQQLRIDEEDIPWP
ncbi:MAG: replicative DNA helicase [Bacillota bacterium]